jgi:Schlafen, AlbA_2
MLVRRRGHGPSVNASVEVNRVDLDQLEVADVKKILESAGDQCAWIRAVLASPRTSPHPLYVDVFLGPQLTSWAGPRTWSYLDVAFTATQSTAGSVAGALAAGDESVEPLDLGLAQVELRALSGRVIPQREPSLTQFDRDQCPWPTLAFDISLTHDQRTSVRLPTGFVVGEEETPTFPVAQAAFNAFFYGDYRISGVNETNLNRVYIRFADVRARLRRVRVTPTAMEVMVEGNDLAGVKLEVNSAHLRSMHDLTSPGLVSIPLPDGMPDDAWIWLKKSTNWLDFRCLGGWGAYQQPSVTIEMPEDPDTDLSSLISLGEGQHLEFKCKLPDTKDEKRNAFKTVAAFASRGGGSMVFGVRDRSGEIVGLGDDKEILTHRFTEMVRDLVQPNPEFTATPHVLDGKTLLVVEVLASVGRVHALMLEPKRPEYYVRRGATTFFARPDELQEALQQSPEPIQNVFASQHPLL